MSRPAMTVIELLTVIAVLAILATVAAATVANTAADSDVRDTAATLEPFQSAIYSYKALYGRWPVDRGLAPAGQPWATTLNATVSAANKNILFNLRRDWGAGNFTAFPADRVRLDNGEDTGDGRAFLADSWGRPLRCKLRTELRGGQEVLVGVTVYSAGPDGLDAYADLQGWQASGGSGDAPGDAYQRQLADRQADHPNVDNVYLSAE